MTLQEFIAMGGYAFYVWGAYAVALIVLLANVIQPLYRRRRLMRELANRNRMQRPP